MADTCFVLCNQLVHEFCANAVCVFFGCKVMQTARCGICITCMWKKCADGRCDSFYVFFPATGGGYWCAIFPDWCKPGAEVGLGCFLGIGWPVHRNQKLVLEIPFFGFKILFFGENMVLRFHFLVLRFHFLGLRSVDEISARFPRNCQRNPKW